MEKDTRTYSTWGRPFRLQLSVTTASDFDAPASRGRCQWTGCEHFEWDTRRVYCRDHWLAISEIGGRRWEPQGCSSILGA